MDSQGSIFLDFRLPNATSWFYISLLVSVGLFFRFARPLSLRNWDLLLLFALVPPLIFLGEARTHKERADRDRQREAGLYAGQAVLSGGAAALHDVEPTLVAAQFTTWRRDRLETKQSEFRQAERVVWRSYLALLVVSGFFLARCLIDLALPRRPPFVPNLNTSGLVFIGLALLSVIGVKAMLPPAESAPDGQTTSIVLARATDAAAQAAERVGRASEVDSGLWMLRALAIACHAIVVLGLVFIGARHFQSLHAGVGAAVLYLLLPYTARYVQELNHVLPAALIVLALAAYRRPILSGLILGLAAASVYFPVMLFPAWFGFYRGRGAKRFTLAFAAVLVVILGVFFLSPVLRPEMASAMVLPDWKPWNMYEQPTSEGLWAGLELHYAYRGPLFLAYLVLVGVSAFWPSPKNLAHLIALSAALILGVQFWYADAGGVYVLWYLPMLVLVILRPNLTARLAPEPNGANHGLRRAWAWVRQRVRKPSHQPVA